MSNEVNKSRFKEKKESAAHLRTKALQISSAQKLCVFFFLTIQFPEESHKSLCSPKKEPKVNKEAIYETVCKNHKTIMSKIHVTHDTNVKQTLLSMAVTCEPR